MMTALIEAVEADDRRRRFRFVALLLIAGLLFLGGCWVDGANHRDGARGAVTLPCVVTP